MPGRNNHAAPKFDRKPASLSIFLDEIEQLAGTCKLSKKQTMEWTIRYAPNEERELWEMQDSIATAKWIEFKRNYLIYTQDLPGSKNTRNIRNAEELGAYRRSFLTIATFLKNKSWLTDREISGYFMQRMESSFRAEVQSQLRAEDPRHHSNDPYMLAEISSAALFILTYDVWQRSGLPLRADKTIVMESANLTKNKTMGLIKNLKLTIGRYDFYIQAQVVKDAPYKVLLGWPFFTLTQASHQHFSNGNSWLTVLDPNSHELITIPTRPWNQNNIIQGS
ncbi:hypothetical protein BYT27DRAFT_7226508 [Phlegmacium glaucopus]|nr:hypothetical protein BYT27DRAFT_7226508 [Phlegmacium glaucopus]